MYVEPLYFYYLMVMALGFSTLCGLLGYLLLTSRRVGGLTFVNLGRFGASFYFRRN